MFGQLGKLLVPQSYREDQKPSEGFVRKLQSIFGTDLHVEWNPKKMKWVIEQCIQHSFLNADVGDGITHHNHLCQRIYVWLVRDEATDEFMPLCDRVIEKLHEMETYRQFGTGEAALARFRQASKDFDDEQAKKIRESARDMAAHSRKFNRTTWNKFYELFRRHDMRENK
jgi:hypothetical protein